MLIVNYHKTGFLAVEDLLDVLDDGAMIHGRQCRTTSDDSRAAVEASRVQHWCDSCSVLNWWSPDMTYVSPERFGQKCFSAVMHFVRHPALWIVSFRDYHSQIPLPHGEGWSLQVRDLCKKQPAFEATYNLVPEIDALHTDCNERFNTGKGHSLYSLLKTLPEHEGLRLSLYFLLFGGEIYERSVGEKHDRRIVGGDILRAAGNTDWFGRLGAHVINVDTDELVLHRHATISGAMHQVDEFFPGISTEGAQRLERAWDHRQAEAMSHNSEHTTTHKDDASIDRKHALACSLIQDQVMGPVVRSMAMQMLGEDRIGPTCST